MQVATRWRESVAVHVTVVVPIWKSDSLGGEQVEVTGGAPPLASAAPYTTAVDCPVGDVTDTALGQAIVGPSGKGSGGMGVDLLVQRAAAIAQNRIGTRRFTKPCG